MYLPSYRKFPVLCGMPFIARGALQRAKQRGHTAEENAADVACLKRSGLTDEALRKFLQDNNFTEEEANTLVPPPSEE